ncbi:MAG TPA: phosphoenolpyruvate--protein phosphotransferase [Candidatus Binatia bacterium]|nr:phosphoenolpyruvate--protein phosphotransferase [Candidatus Binatia bacterium]
MEAETRKPPRRRSEKPRTHGFKVLEDISAITARSEDLQETLQRIVEVVAERANTDVCSLYILDARAQRLTLWATTGLAPSSVGKVQMSVEEGLTGMAIEKMEPVMAVDALTHPRYKFFPETGEEKYHSFLGVPIVERGTPIGVLVVQTLRRRKFSAHEIRLLRAIATQVGSIIAQARLLEDLKSKEKERRDYRRRMFAAIKQLQAHKKTSERTTAAAESRTRLHGLAAAPGFGRGQAHLLEPSVSFDRVDDERAEGADDEKRRFRRALKESAAELDSLKERLSERMPEFDAGIIDAHRMMLRDRGFTGKIEEAIDEGLAAEAALKHVVEDHVGRFMRMSDGYLRDRALDVKDVGLRILRNLLGVVEPERPLEKDSVLVAHELTLSDLALIEHEHLRAIVLATGGVTSHASILARSFEIPTVVGAEHLTETVHEGDDLIVDGNSGVIFVNPPVDVAREYDRLEREYRAFNRELETLKNLPAETTDGRRVSLYANMGLVADLQFAHAHGAQGIGLYRTEFPFLTYREFPDEEEQYELYARVVQDMAGRPVTIRTLDVGADKLPAYMQVPREDNPYLGWRSIRISLEMPEFFKVQLRAILRAAALGRVRVMFPMISSVEEIRRAKELLEEAKEELRREGREFEAGVQVGMMVEVPSAVALAHQLVREVDFFSIGTNDLIQYLLAVDRNNRKVAPLYEPLHPAVLGAVHEVVQAAKGAGKWVGMCGEMASDPQCTLVLLGLGLDDLSMGPFFIPVIKRIVRSVSYAAARNIARDTLSMATIKEVKGYLFDGMKSLGIIELMEMYH